MASMLGIWWSKHRRFCSLTRAIEGTRLRHAARRQSRARSGIESKLLPAEAVDAASSTQDAEAPIFILSSGWRSGSTLLQRTLMSDPETIIWGEPYARCNLFLSMAEQTRPFSEHWPPQDFFVEGRSDSESDSHGFIANLYPPIGGLREAHRAFLDRLFGDPARNRGYSKWGVKETRLAGLEVRYLRWVYPNAKFLFLVRSPLDSYRSYIGMGPWFGRWPEEIPATAWSFGRYWNRIVLDFVEEADAGNGIVLRYESLEDDIDKASAYLGMPLKRPSELPVIRSRFASGPRRRVLLDPIERSILAASTRRGRRAVYLGDRT